jgi:hypothetical protein
MGEQGPVRDAKDLETAAGDVAYEIETMLFAADHLESGHSSPAREPEGKEMDVFLESFLIHYRNLRAFLCPGLQAKRKTDVFAWHFLLYAEEPTDEGDLVTLRRDRERINACLAHISYNREDYRRAGDWDWEVQRMRDEMVQNLRDFLLRVEPSRRAWFLRSEFLAAALGMALETGQPAP